MRIYHLFFLFFLLCMQSLNAKNQTETFRMPRIEYAGEVTCNLPAPSSLTVNTIGSNWVNVSWPAVPGAVQYRLQAFDGGNGTELAAPVYVSATTTNANVSTIGNNGTAYVRIWSVCAFGEYETTSFTQSVTFDSIVLDLVTSGYQMPNSEVTIPVELTGVPISWTGSMEYFKIGYAGESRDFGLNVKANPDPNPDLVQIWVGDNPNWNENKKIVLLLNIEEGVGVGLLVKYRSDVQMKPQMATTIAELKVSEVFSTQLGSIYRTNMNYPDCNIRKVIPQAPPLFKAPISESFNDRDADVLTIEQPSVRPNPFRDAITVQLPEPQSPTETVMHLYDLLGARLMTYHVPANQPECTLNTSQLKTGVYFLRIESNGKLETIKLLKTE